MENEEAVGHFGFHLVGGKDEPHPKDPAIQTYVMSSALSRSANLAISSHLMTPAEIDRFISDAVATFQAIRIDAKKALATANR